MRGIENAYSPFEICSIVNRYQSNTITSNLLCLCCVPSDHECVSEYSVFIEITDISEEPFSDTIDALSAQTSRIKAERFLFGSGVALASVSRDLRQ